MLKPRRTTLGDKRGIQTYARRKVITSAGIRENQKPGKAWSGRRREAMTSRLLEWLEI